MHQFADDPPIERTVGEALADRGETVAVAESFTGGLVGALLTEVPGSSDYFDRSLVTYTYDAKADELGIDRTTLAERGAVDATVAAEMAGAVREKAGTDWGVSTTGIAGPADEHDQPVGTAYVGVAGPPEESDSDDVPAPRTVVGHYEFEGTRSEIKELGARRALGDLREALAPG